MKPSNKILSNLTHLGLMQMTNYIVPLIAIPILLSTVGLQKYGVIALAQGISNIFVTITDYGLNLTGTRSISQDRDRPDKLKLHVIGILHLRVLLTITCFIILFLLTNIIPSWKEEQFVILTSFLLVIAQSIFPIWYFQGVQKMQFINFVNLSSRIVYLLCLIVFINKETDYIFVNIFNGLSWLIATSVALYYVIFKVNISFTISSFPIRKIVEDLKNNFPIFLSRFAVTSHRNGAIVIAGFFLTSGLLGIYSIIDKILMLLSSSSSIIFRALFPQVSEMAKKKDNSLRHFFQRFWKISIPLSIGVGAMILLLGEWILVLLSKEASFTLPSDIANHLAIITCFPLLLVLNLPMSLELIALDLKKSFFIFNASGLVIMWTIGLLGCNYFQLKGLLVSIIFAEIAMLIAGTSLLKNAKKSRFIS